MNNSVHQQLGEVVALHRQNLNWDTLSNILLYNNSSTPNKRNNPYNPYNPYNPHNPNPELS